MVCYWQKLSARVKSRRSIDHVGQKSMGKNPMFQQGRIDYSHCKRCLPDDWTYQTGSPLAMWTSLWKSHVFWGGKSKEIIYQGKISDWRNILQIISILFTKGFPLNPRVPYQNWLTNHQIDKENSLRTHYIDLTWHISYITIVKEKLLLVHPIDRWLPSTETDQFRMFSCIEMISDQEIATFLGTTFLTHHSQIDSSAKNARYPDGLSGGSHQKKCRLEAIKRTYGSSSRLNIQDFCWLYGVNMPRTIPLVG